MRKSIVIAVSVVSSLALSACGQSHQGKAQAKVAQVKVKVAEAKSTGDTKEQKANYNDINSQIEAKRVELRKMRFHGADVTTSELGVVANAVDNILPGTNKNHDKIVQKLGEMKDLAKVLVDAAKDLKDQGKIKYAEETQTVISDALNKIQGKQANGEPLPNVVARAYESVASVLPPRVRTVVEYPTRTSLGAIVTTWGAAKNTVNKVFPPFEGSPEFQNVKSKIDAKVAELNQLGYHDQDESFSFTEIGSDAKHIFVKRSAEELGKIKSILEAISADGEELVQVANDGKDEYAKKVANYVNQLAKKNIKDVEKAEKQLQKAAFKASKQDPSVLVPFLDQYI